MRKIIYLLCILFVSAMQVACSNDNEEELVTESGEVAPPSGFQIINAEQVSVTGYLSKHTWQNYTWRLTDPTTGATYEIGKYPSSINLNDIEGKTLTFKGTQKYYLFSGGGTWSCGNDESFYSLNIESIAE